MKRLRPTIKKKNGGAYFSAPAASLTFIHTGAKILDCVLGGGWPLGRVVNVVGDRSSGKTLLGIEACANFARAFPRGHIWYNEAESAFDVAYAEVVGLPRDRVQMKEDCDTVEAFFDHLTAALKSVGDEPGLYILDSLDALSDEAEMKRGIEEGSYAMAKAKKMSELFRRLVRLLKTSNVCLIIISQVRDKIGVAFGDKHARTGGKALDFYASQVLYLAQLGTIKRTIDKVERAVGVEIRAKVKKNKVGIPMRECEFNILFGYGVDDIGANLDWLDAVGKLSEFRGMRHTRLTSYVNGLDKLSRSELSVVRKEVDALVVKNWYRIEEGFLPTRKKYA